MGPVIGDILPLALGVAISPIPIIAAILMLFSPRAAATSTGFLIGWVVGIIVATGIFTALAGSIGSGGDSSAWSGWTKIVLGGLLLSVGFRQFRGRHDKHGTPKWMSAIDSLTFAKALGLGFLLVRDQPEEPADGHRRGRGDRVRRAVRRERGRRRSRSSP